ncbi:TPA: glycosyltransferase family 4 protein [Vibrio campbellii]|nr:glycosyltransferase family 4 protein [Vibrio campbellii]
MRKIAHIQVIPKLSGVQMISFDILKSLDNTYNKTIIFGSEYECSNEFIKVFEDINVKVVFVKNLKREIGMHDIKAFIELWKLFKQEQYDIVHTNSTKPGIIARIAAKMCGLKVIHTVHGISFHKQESFIKRNLYYIIESFSNLFSDKLITVNRLYLKYYPLVKYKKCIYNGIEFDHSINFKKKEKEKFTIGFLSRLDPQKDPITLLKAINHLVKENNLSEEKVEVIVGGGGELEFECKQYVLENDLSKFVKFIGWVKPCEKKAFYESIDVFCLPSSFEAFGLVFLEAANYKIPSVATRVEGIPEVIIDGETGLLVEVKDYQMLSEKLYQCYKNEVLVQNLGDAAYKRAINKFTLKKMNDQYKNLYQEILNES